MLAAVVADCIGGTCLAGRPRLFRSGVHCWRGGSISNVAWANASPTLLTSDEVTYRRLLASV